MLRAIVVCVTLGGCASARPSATPNGPTASAVARTPAIAQLQAHELIADDGHRLRVWSKSPSAPTHVIVLLHGRTWSSRPDFDLQVAGESRSLMDALVARGDIVYALDMRGYGETPRDGSGWLTPDRAASDLALALAWVHARHPHLPKPALLGWSLGSLVAQLCAQRNPDALSALVLYGYPRSPEQRYEAERPVAQPDRRPTTREAAAEDFKVAGATSVATEAAFVAAAVAADPIRMDWRASDQWNALDPAAVRVPTLVIHGSADPYAVQSAQAALVVGLASEDKRWIVLPQSDHAAHLERAGAAFVAAVDAFVER